MYKTDGPNGPMWFNEKKTLIDGLTHGSNKKVKTICPECNEERESIYQDIVKAGHSYCRYCSRTIKNKNKLLNKRFGKLLVVGFGEPILSSQGNKRLICICLCECGATIEVRADNLISGHATSCGCIRVENAKMLNLGRTGPEHPGYNFDLTDEQRKDRKISRRSGRYARWSKAVKDRDKCCAICDATENLEAHHFEGFADNVDLRFVLENGIALCVPCHDDYHAYLKRKKLKATKATLNAYILEKKNSKTGKIKKSLTSLLETFFGY